MIKIVAGFFIMMVVISAGAVYSLKETTERLEARKQQLSAKILKDRSSIKVLRAEMAYLSQPERLQKLSKRFLALSPSRAYQMTSSVNAIAGRDDMKLVSLPADEFPVLLPQEKPEFQRKKFDQSVVLATYPLKPTGQKAKVVKASFVKTSLKPNVKKSFYERISLKVGEEE